ncbi:MAG: sigma-70 family RNA polymerase sigma factor [Actinomycetota bacterium]|nr:sigma-70 family RNA polymerase sigma factor [Actinomycetota bacterium]
MSIDQSIRNLTSGRRSDVDSAPRAIEPLGDVASAYRDHADAVFRAAASVCPSAAEDITQEVFFQLWRQPARYESSGGTLRTFLVTVAHDKAVNVARSETSRHASEKPNKDSQRLPSPQSLNTELLDNGRATSFADALSRLPATEREAIVVAFFGRCTYREAALSLAEAEGTIKSRIRDGLNRLSIALAEFPPEVPASLQPVELGQEFT